MVIERLFRGHVGRKDRRNRNLNRVEFMHQGRRNYFAIQIQKSFRGFHSRKYKKDHGKRKRYLQHVVAKGEEIRLNMQKYAEEQELVHFIQAFGLFPLPWR